MDMVGIRQPVQLLHDFMWEIEAQRRHLPEVMLREVPYVSQFARPQDVERIVRKVVSPMDDPHWRLSGASSPQEYDLWARAMCGMACAVMVFRHSDKNKSQKLVTLAKDAMKSGVYVYEKEGRVGDMRYAEFAMWVRKYGFRAKVHSRLSIRGIQLAVAKGWFPIVSVHPRIREEDAAYGGPRGGHMVLVTGYDAVRQVLVINNPSGFMNTATQENHVVSEAVFLKYFAGRGVCMVNSHE